jgi:hypothetical protein
MATQKLSNQRIHEVQQVLASYVPKLPGTDVNLLAALCKAVLTSVDLRDIRRVASAELVEQLEQVLSTIKTRGRGEINSVVRRHEGSVVLESCLEDQPFLVSSLRALFGAERLEIASLMNAVIKVRRDAAGNLTSIGMGAPESVIRVELDPGQHVPEDIEDRFRTRLRIVQAMVRDFQPMKRRLQDLADDYLRAANAESNDRSLTLRETEGMVRWLCEENLVLLGVEEYDEQGQRISTLGTASVHTSERDADRFAAYARDLDRTVRYHRSNEESPVHRSGKPGHFVVTRVGRDGQPVGTCLINGLFTYKALHTPPEEIPFLRVMLRKLLTERSVSIDSHRGKSLTNAFNSLPLEYLLTQSEDSIWELTDRVLRARQADEALEEELAAVFGLALETRDAHHEGRAGLVAVELDGAARGQLEQLLGAGIGRVGGVVDDVDRLRGHAADGSSGRRRAARPRCLRIRARRSGAMLDRWSQSTPRSSSSCRSTSTSARRCCSASAGRCWPRAAATTRSGCSWWRWRRGSAAASCATGCSCSRARRCACRTGATCWWC